LTWNRPEFIKLLRERMKEEGQEISKETTETFLKVFTQLLKEEVLEKGNKIRIHRVGVFERRQNKYCYVAFRATGLRKPIEELA